MSRKEAILEFIEDELLDDDDEEIEDDTSLFEGRILDSLNLLSLVDYLEKTYKIKIKTSEINVENLDTLANIDRFLTKKLDG